MSVETEVKEYKNLGIMNGWKEQPKEYKECCEKKHTHIRQGSSVWSCYNYYSCPICKIRYEVDSSG